MQSRSSQKGVLVQTWLIWRSTSASFIAPGVSRGGGRCGVKGGCGRAV
jgi:hypothetical protein